MWRRTFGIGTILSAIRIQVARYTNITPNGQYIVLKGLRFVKSNGRENVHFWKRFYGIPVEVFQSLLLTQYSWGSQKHLQPLKTINKTTSTAYFRSGDRQVGQWVGG